MKSLYEEWLEQQTQLAGPPDEDHSHRIALGHEPLRDPPIGFVSPWHREIPADQPEIVGVPPLADELPAA